MNTKMKNLIYIIKEPYDYYIRAMTPAFIAFAALLFAFPDFALLWCAFVIFYGIVACLILPFIRHRYCRTRSQEEWVRTKARIDYEISKEKKSPEGVNSL